MVVKSLSSGKPQQQQLHLVEREYKILDEQQIETSRVDHCLYSPSIKFIINHGVTSRKRVASPRRGRRRGGVHTSIAFILLVISLQNELVQGASVNPSLEDDLLLNSNNNHGVTTPSSTSPTGRTSARTTTTTTRPSSGRDNDTTLAQQHDNAHINFTIPVQASPNSSVIVKHGSIIYEVVNNRTVTTNVDMFAVPSRSSPSRLGVYQQMTASIIGLRVEDTNKGVTYDEGVSVIMANSQAVIRLFGSGFTNNTIIRFVTEADERGADCDDVTSTKYFRFDKSLLTANSAVITVQLPPLDDGEKYFYVCAREDNEDMPWIHQGTSKWIMLTSYEKWLPVWAHIIMLVVLLGLSGLFSGLNLGLMAIDRTEIKIIINAGSEKERKHAKKIRPLRDNGNYLLCSLLLGNVLVNATLTILLDDLTSGLIAVIGSTVGIVIFGEIVPQAVCSRHGLAVGAKTVLITKLFMAITFPLSYPISVILDKVLGEEIGNVYNRERLKELVRVTQGENDLEKDEVNIISGALELKQKMVLDVMTRLEEVFMLPIDAVLDFDTVSEIMSNGYSRIPVYEHTRGNVISLLYTKDLAFVDPDDKMPLKTICEFYSNACHFVFENVTLDVLFKVFKQGNKGHMAFVQRVKTTDKSDPIYEVIGLITLEDVIEELIQEEINDETDVWEIEHKKRSRGNSVTEAAITNWKSEGWTTISPQLTLAAFQYLSTAVHEFNDLRISKTVLERLLKQNIYHHIKIKNKDTMKTDSKTVLYERGKPVDYFVMILEGRAHAEVGTESLVFESGPFSYFGTKCLSQYTDEVLLTPARTRRSSASLAPDPAALHLFTPDYTVRAVTDMTYFKISRSMYQAAKQATLLEKTYLSSDTSMGDDKIDEHLQKHLEELKNNKDGKSMDKSLTVSTPTEISEKRLQEAKEDKNGAVLAQPNGHLPDHRPQMNHHHHLQQQPLSQPMIGDNNNICLTVARNVGQLMEKQDDFSHGNMSRVIICPRDEKPPADSHQETSFQGKIIVDVEEKCYCKL